MPIEEVTLNQGYQKPHEDNALGDDVERLRTAVDQIDGDVAALNAQIAGLPQPGHTHTITQIGGLQTALDAKAPVSSVPTSINDLPDVNVSGAVTAQFLVLNGSTWQAVTFTAELITDGTIHVDRLPSYLQQSVIDAKAEDATAAKTNATNEFENTQKGKMDTLTYDPSMTINHTTGAPFQAVPVNGDALLSVSNIVANAPITIYLINDGVGGHTFSYGPEIDFLGQAPFDTSTLAPNQVAILTGIGNHDGSKVLVGQAQETV